MELGGGGGRGGGGQVPINSSSQALGPPFFFVLFFLAQEVCESRGRGLPVPSCPYGLSGRKATLNLHGPTKIEETVCSPLSSRLTALACDST